jgi:RNA polymerase sigma-70 factor (ECF subfamily)
LASDENQGERTLQGVAPTPDTPDFDAVYRANVGLVWRTLRRAGVPESMLEDATQEVFLVYHRRHDEFERASSVRTWLLGIARGVAANVRRGQQRFLRRLASRRVEPSVAVADDPETRACRAEAEALVEAFLARLAPAMREVFELVEIEELKQREVAEVLGISINTVGSRLRAARAEWALYVHALDTPEAANA